MNISSALKRKRDAEERARKRPKYYGEAEAVGIITSVDDFTAEATGLPPEDEPLPSADDGTGTPNTGEQIATIKKFQREYIGAIWEVKHSLGDDPLFTIWVHGAGKMSFGIQEFGLSSFGGSASAFGWREFGTSYFGGQDGTDTRAYLPSDAVVKKVDSNTIRVEWTKETSGKVVAIA